MPVGNTPWGVAYDSAKNEVFVSNEEDSSVSVISDSNNQVGATITGSISAPEGIAFDSAKDEMFVADWDAASFSVISDKNNAVVTTVDMSLADDAAGNPTAVAYDSAKGEVFVACPGGTLQLISDSSNAVVSYIALGSGLAAEGVAYDSGKGETFVGTYNSVLAVISDSASTSASATPTSAPSGTSTASASPTPTVPEFSSAMLVLVAAAIVIVTLGSIAIGRKKVKKSSQLRIDETVKNRKSKSSFSFFLNQIVERRAMVKQSPKNPLFSIAFWTWELSAFFPKASYES